ncbi:MAG: type VI secretion system tip protein VgrG, partial [Rhodobacteraceae bacterium]|nr:type VI secretion system tip protein VgrG [Paracoccaceae bacterium]
SAYAGLGNPHLEVQVSEDYPVLEYTVQYGETDADLVRRQLERHGITWSWRHEAGSHTMLLTDAAFSLPQVPGGSRPYYGVAGYHRHEDEHFRSWSPAQRITTGAVRLTEYNFKIPVAAQEAEQLSEIAHPSSDIESYDWPGDYLTQGEGRGVADRRLQEERGHALRHHAEGDAVSLGAGWRVTLAGDEVRGATGETFVCLKASHRFRAQAYGSGDAGGDEAPYEGSYVLTPEAAPFRPERRTTGPRVQGPETAVVVGDGEIDCDEHGRILVRFHWDWEKAHTMRVRVSQNWASQGWGGMVIPRIGMEVIVEHLRGDPDKPIVTGCVYNGKNKPPYELPKHKTKSVFRTDSHNGKGFNELRFEDELGQEEIFVHAERDINIGIENDKRTSVGGNVHFQTRGNDTSLTYGEHVSHAISLRAMTSGDTMLIASGNDETVRPVSPHRFLTGDHDLRDQSHPRLNVGHARTVQKGSMLLHSAADMMISSDDEFQIQSDKSLRVSSLDTLSLTSPADLKLSSQERVIVEASKGIAINSESGIVLRSGSARIRLSPDGKIEIDGTQVIVKGDRICLN